MNNIALDRLIRRLIVTLPGGQEPILRLAPKVKAAEEALP